MLDQISADDVSQWFIKTIASRARIDPSAVETDKYFDEFELDSTEALVIAGELEEWLGFDISPTTMWYYPTIDQLSAHIAAEVAAR